MNDRSIYAVLRYFESCLFMPKSGWSKYYFTERSYARWAVCEIIKEITDHPFKPASESIEDFILKMHCYSTLSCSTDICLRFVIARDTAEDILDYLKNELLF